MRDPINVGDRYKYRGANVGHTVLWHTRYKRGGVIATNANAKICSGGPVRLQQKSWKYSVVYFSSDGLAGEAATLGSGRSGISSNGGGALVCPLPAFRLAYTSV